MVWSTSGSVWTQTSDATTRMRNPRASACALTAAQARSSAIAIITGDTSSDTMQQVASLDVQVWHKPVEPALLRGQLRHRSPPAE